MTGYSTGSRHPAAKDHRFRANPERQVGGDSGQPSPPAFPSLPLSQRSGRTSALPYVLPRPFWMLFDSFWSGNRFPCRSASPSLHQFPITLRMNHRCQPIQLIGRRDVSDRGVQPNVVVAGDVSSHLATRLLDGRWTSDNPPALRSFRGRDVAVGSGYFHAQLGAK